MYTVCIEMESNWINYPLRLKWHPPEFEYYQEGCYDVLLDYFMERDWVFHSIPNPVQPKLYRGVIVSIAGSGLTPWEDRIFNISLLGFNCDRFGYIYQFVSNLDEWENPRRDISYEQLEFMRLTKAAYRFQTFHEEDIELLVHSADFIIMLDAREERKILEARFPIFKTKPFVSLKHDVDWHLLRGVPRGAHVLEYYAYLQGKKITIRRPAEEVLLIGWLLTLQNPVTPGPAELGLDPPPLMQEITNFALSDIARIYVDGNTISAPQILGRDGFEWDPVTNVWYVDVPIEYRYPLIQRIRMVLYGGANYPVAWMPISGPSSYHYGERILIPTEEERANAISELSTAILLHDAEDFLAVVPRPKRVHDMYVQAGLLPPPRAHESEGPHLSLPR